MSSNSIAELKAVRAEWLGLVEILQRLVTASQEANVETGWLIPHVTTAVTGLQQTADTLTALTQEVSNV